MHETYRTIEITGALLEAALPAGSKYGIDGCCTAQRPTTACGDVVRQIDSGVADCVRRLLLVVDSPGGSVECARIVAGELERFRRNGGVVVAYVRQADSSAPLVAVAADFVVLDPAGRFYLHESSPPDRALHEQMAAALSRGTGTHPLILADFQDHNPVVAMGDEALRFGFADEIGTLERARELAAGRALPESIRSRRIASLVAANAESIAPVSRHVTASSECSFSGLPHLPPQVGAHLTMARNLVARTAPAPHTGGDLMDVFGAIYAQDQWVIVGGETSSYAYPFVSRSYDSNTWSTVYPPSGAFNAPLRAIVWNGTTYVTVGSQRCYTSPDAVTWTQRTIGALQWYGLAWNGTYWVAVGQHIAASGNAVTWSDVTTPSATLNAVVWTGTRFIAVGGLVAARSTDGLFWSEVSLPGSAGTDVYASVSTGNGRVVALGVNNAAAYSDDDGATWTQITLPAQPDGNARSIRSVVWTGQAFVAVQDSTGLGAIYTSTDGVLWSIASSAMPYASGYTAIGWSGMGILCAGPSSIATSLLAGA